MRARSLAVAMIAALASACAAVLDVDFDGHLAAAPAEIEADAGASDATVVDAPSGDDAFWSRKTALDGARVRIDAAPLVSRHTVSKSWFLWVDTAGAGHALRPGDGARRDVNSAFEAANDDFVVLRSKTFLHEVHDAATGVEVFSRAISGAEAVALDDGIAFINDGLKVSFEFLPNGGELVDAGGIGTPGVKVVGQTARAMFLRGVNTPKLWTSSYVPGARFANTSRALTFDPMYVAEHPGGVVISHLAPGGGHLFKLAPASGADVDLSARILAAPSDVPTAERSAVGPALTDGAWIVFSARAGILAYRPEDDRLVPVQLRAREASTVFFETLGFVRASRSVVFTVEGSLFYAKLDAVLPPD